MKPKKLRAGMMWIDTTDGTLRMWNGKKWIECSLPPGPPGPMGPCGMTGEPGRDGMCYREEIRWSWYAGRSGAFGLGLFLTTRSAGLRFFFWEFELRRTKQMVPIWCDQLVGAVAKTLSANAPFISVINGGKFPENMGDSCNTCSPKKS